MFRLFCKDNEKSHIGGHFKKHSRLDIREEVVFILLSHYLFLPLQQTNRRHGVSPCKNRRHGVSPCKNARHGIPCKNVRRDAAPPTTKANN